MHEGPVVPFTDFIATAPDDPFAAPIPLSAGQEVMSNEEHYLAILAEFGVEDPRKAQVQKPTESGSAVATLLGMLGSIHPPQKK
jgi:hypothetical protein